MTAPIVKSNLDYLPRAIEVLKRGGLVISPTTTNYNLVCDATNAAAVSRVFAVKQRVKFGPLPVSLPHPSVAARYVELPDWFDPAVLDALLPGEISFVFRQKFPFPDQLTCGLHSVAISCTTHPVFRTLTVGLNGPIAATSANLSGQGNIFVPLAKAIEDIGDLVDLIIDAGPTAAELAGGGDRVNTIVDLTFDRPYLVRAGWVGLDTVQAYFPALVTDTAHYQEVLARRVAERNGCPA
jgi:L-threonylcarbamoyladenylate synthase